MDEERAKQIKEMEWYGKFWTIMSWVIIVWGAISAAGAIFSLRTGNPIGSIMGLCLILIAIALTAVTRSAAKEAREMSEQLSQPK